MTLPLSGPLSLSMIAAELGTSPPYSLRNMSNTAGFVPPDAVSEFYGYPPVSNCSYDGFTILCESPRSIKWIGDEATAFCEQEDIIFEIPFINVIIGVYGDGVPGYGPGYGGTDYCKPAVSPDNTPYKNFMYFNQTKNTCIFSVYKYIDASWRLGTGSVQQYIPNPNYIPNNPQIKVGQVTNVSDYPATQINLIGSGRLGENTGLGIINTSGEIFLTTYDNNFAALYKGDNMTQSTFRVKTTSNAADFPDQSFQL